MRGVRSRRPKAGSALGALYILGSVVAAAGGGSPLAPELRSEEKVVPVPQQKILKFLEQVMAKPESELTDREKLALSRAAKMKLPAMSSVNEKEYFEALDQVKSYKEVKDTESTLTVPVRHEEKGSYLQVMNFDKTELSRIREWLMNIDDDHIREKFPGARGEELIMQKLVAPNDYVRNALVQIANTNETIRRWLFRSADEHHPLWNADGTVKKDLLPEGWTTIHFKGSGEAPILKEDLPLAPRLQDAYFWRKLDRAHPVTRRNMAKEYDIRRNPNGWIFDMIARKLNAVRPADLDRDYFFDLDQPFTNAFDVAPADPALIESLNNKFLVKDPVIGRILGDVPAQDRTRPLPALGRREIMELGFRAKLVKTLAEGGDYAKKNGSDPLADGSEAEE